MYSPYPNRNGITWIQGIEGAKAYPLMPNSNVILMDSESDKFYIKTSDTMGVCTLRTFSYKEIVQPTNDYITREELEKIIEEIRNEQFISKPAESADE